MHRNAFTLMELLVVVTVILALAGISYPVMNRMRAKADIDSTKMLVNSIHTAITHYDQKFITGIDGPIYHAWTLGWDGTTNAIDGDPQLYPAANVIRTRAPASYRGLAYMAGLQLSSKQLDQFGRIVDRWRQPLQLSYAANTYGDSPFGVWSMGPDKTNGTPDDILSTTNNEQ